MASEASPRNERRDEIIKCSAELFDKVGYHMASMQMIADAVGLGKPTLYHYFKSKSEILYEMHRGLMAELMQSLSTHEAKALAADEMLRAISRDTVKFIREHPGYIRAFFEHYDDLDDTHKELIRKQRSDYLKMISSIIKDGMDAGIFETRDPRVSALVFLGILNWTYQWMPSQKNVRVAKLADTLSDVFLNGMLTR